jgi:hypothetical protein
MIPPRRSTLPTHSSTLWATWSCQNFRPRQAGVVVVISDHTVAHDHVYVVMQHQRAPHRPDRERITTSPRLVRPQTNAK